MNKPLKRINPDQIGSLQNDNCISCRLRDLCLTSGISQSDLESLDAIVSRRLHIQAGEALFTCGQHFNSLFAIRTGFFKTRFTDTNGREQITGFQLPGELLGLDGFATELHSVDAIALEDSDVCVLQYENLELIAREFSPLQKQLHKVLSREIVKEHGVIMLLGSMKAEERVAAFLLNLSSRYLALGYSPIAFTLRMSRADLGSYLGMKIETVSRTFTRLQKEQLIHVSGKELHITNPNGLRSIVSSTI